MASNLSGFNEHKTTSGGVVARSLLVPLREAHELPLAVRLEPKGKSHDCIRRSAGKQQPAPKRRDVNASESQSLLSNSCKLMVMYVVLYSTQNSDPLCTKLIIASTEVQSKNSFWLSGRPKVSMLTY